MASPSAENPPVSAKVVLFDRRSLNSLWLNEAAAADLAAPGEPSEGLGLGLPAEQAVPIAQILGLPKALRAAAKTGEPQHLWTDLVSTSKGSVKIVASVYLLPTDQLLVVMENAWQPVHRSNEERANRRHPGRPRR